MPKKKGEKIIRRTAACKKGELVSFPGKKIRKTGENSQAILQGKKGSGQKKRD